MGFPSERKIVVGLGEILWDMLPEGKQLGGAPANFAYHADRLGERGIAASRIGKDELGGEILARLSELKLDLSGIQIDEKAPTGTVKVQLGPGGQPSYTIVEGVAWDRLEWTPGWEQLAQRTDAVCFGSLAQRSEVSRRTIHSFLRACRPEAVRIFDINLRGDFYSKEVLQESLQLSRIAKLNDEELPKVGALLGLTGEGEVGLAKALRTRFELDLVCVTRGARGSLLVARDEVSEHPGFQVVVADTVGSGDAFVAAVAHHFMRGASLERINEAANKLGAFVASRRGATPEIPAGNLKH